jgi:hypothetical protein
VKRCGADDSVPRGGWNGERRSKARLNRPACREEAILVHQLDCRIHPGNGQNHVRSSPARGQREGRSVSRPKNFWRVVLGRFYCEDAGSGREVERPSRCSTRLTVTADHARRLGVGIFRRSARPRSPAAADRASPPAPGGRSSSARSSASVERIFLRWLENVETKVEVTRAIKLLSCTGLSTPRPGRRAETASVLTP